MAKRTLAAAKMKQHTLRCALLIACSALLSSQRARGQSCPRLGQQHQRGLSRYEPAACIFKPNHGGGSCLVQKSSQILISPDGRSVLNVNDNGTPR
jgi:hypothetical protein